MNNEALSPELKDESITLCDVETHLNVLFNERPVQRILLIHPPDASRSSFNSKIAKRGANYNFPPYGLGVVAQALLEKKLDVKVCNLNQSILKECRNTDDLERFSFQDTWKNQLQDARKMLSKWFPEDGDACSLATEGELTEQCKTLCEDKDYAIKSSKCQQYQ